MTLSAPERHKRERRWRQLAADRRAKLEAEQPMPRKVRDRHRRLREAVMALRASRVNLSPEQCAELAPYDARVEEATGAVIGLDRREDRVRRAMLPDASEEFRAAAADELALIEASRPDANRALHNARVALNRVVRRIDRANRDGCEDCPK